jgi:serine protease SohB
MTYLYEYLIFLAEAITIVVALLIIISAVASLGTRQHNDGQQGHLQVIKVNDRLRGLRYAMEDTLLPAGAVKKQHKQEAKADAQAEKALASDLKGRKKKEKASASNMAAPTEPVGTTSTESDVDVVDETTGRVYVIRFDGDVRASRIDHLRLEVSAILTIAKSTDEVVLCLESPGGMVHSYGLAASQLTRIRNHGIPLTAVVDMVAASGGYLMAAVANRVLAAPFALVGSIGVVAQIPNVHRLLKKNDVDVEVLTAGKYKRTMTVLGENTDEARQKFVEELEDVHALFQEFVAENRPGLDLETVATGEAWYGKRALDLGLVDELATSDEYLMRLCDERDVFEVQWVEHKKPIDKLLGKVNTLLDQASSALEILRR